MAHYHLYIGQEATGSAVMEALGPDDKLATTHRNHGHVLARGADPAGALAEILCRETGLNGGYGGTLHLSDPDLGFIATSSIVGGCIGLATGGGFPAAVSAVKDLTRIPDTFGIPVETVDGRDVDAVFDAASSAVERCRRGEGPAFVQAVTERWEGSKPLWPELPMGDTEMTMIWDESNYAGAFEDWYRVHDPIFLYARQLLDGSDVNQDDILALDRQTTAPIADARQWAVESPLPAAETALENVFVPDRGA